jgi:hypothetical protein
MNRFSAANHQPVRLLAAAIGAAIVLASVSACAGPDPSSSTRPGSRTGAACPVGKWVVDISDLEQQVVDALPETADVVAHSSTGTQTWTFTAHHVTVASDFTIDVTELADQGFTEEVAQHHSGSVQLDWALDGTDMTFSNYDAGDGAVTTTVTVNGTASQGQTIPLSGQNPYGLSLETVCRGAGMTLNTEGTEFTSHLSRAGGS